MIQTIEIHTIAESTQLILDQKYNADIDRLRSPYLFRGMPDTSYHLTTSLRRNCANKQKILEGLILSNFTKYAIREDPSLEKSIWRQMIVGQHFGLPTRLLDWSHSSLIALHFATSETDFARTDKRDGIVWRIDTTELAGLLPKRYREALDKGKTSTFTEPIFNSVVSSTDQYDQDMGDRSMVIIEPPSVDQRIINLYSYFSIIPHEMTDVEGFLNAYTQNTVKYVIRKEVRWELRDLLDQFNVSERIVYPGLDGLSMWIARHYYVKDNPR